MRPGLTDSNPEKHNRTAEEAPVPAQRVKRCIFEQTERLRRKRDAWHVVLFMLSAVEDQVCRSVLPLKSAAGGCGCGGDMVVVPPQQVLGLRRAIGAAHAFSDTTQHAAPLFSKLLNKMHMDRLWAVPDMTRAQETRKDKSH